MQSPAPHAAPLVRAEIALTRWERLLVFGLPLLYLLPILVVGPYDQEEWMLGVYSTFVQSRHLWLGEYPFWLDDLGFGIPLPLGHRLDFAPPFLLWPVASFRVVYSLYWILYLSLGTYFFARVCLVVGIARQLLPICLFSFLFSVATTQFVYTDDWQSSFHDWTLFPVLVFYTLSVARGREGATPLGDTLLLGFWGALFVLNANSAHSAMLAFMLSLFAIVLVRDRPRLLTWYLAAAVIAALGSMEHLYHLVSEMAKFPPGVERNLQNPFSLKDYLLGLVAPIAKFFYFGGEGVVMEKLENYLICPPSRHPDQCMRAPSMGLVFFLAAWMFSVRILWQSRHAGFKQRAWQGVALCFLLSVVLSMTPSERLLKIPTSVWLFRDTLVFFGIAGAGLFFSRLPDRLAFLLPWRPTLLLLQALQVFLIFLPALYTNLHSDWNKSFYEGVGRRDKMKGWLAQWADRKGGRLFVSERFGWMERDFEPEGIYGLTDLTFVGVQPVQMHFKSLSMDRLYPSFAVAHGKIGGEDVFLRHQPLLDVLGINLVLDKGQNPQQPGLRPLDSYVRQGRKREVVQLYHNPTAWPRAVLLDAKAGETALERRGDCTLAGALCLDYTPLAAWRLPGEVTMRGRNGDYRLTVAPTEEKRLLFLSTLYREEWRARDETGGALTVLPLAEGFVAIALPAGVASVRLWYDPGVRPWMVWIEGLTLLLAGVVARRCSRRIR